MSQSLLLNRFLKLNSRFFPGIFWRSYARKARKLRLDGIRLILSFDCDTPEDIPAAEKIYTWLQDHNLKATFAVPGKLLEEGAPVYHNLAKRGAAFINHGAKPHAEWRDGRYWSITFYHEMTLEEVGEDIRLGHEIVTRVTGHAPRGFRAPHFGLFQEPLQMRIQYDALRHLGYRFSTSTMPASAFFHGPIYDVGDLWEVPLLGTFHSPFTIFDSWSHIISPYQPTVKALFAEKLVKTAEWLFMMKIPAVLNYYVDPAHVSSSESFYLALENLLAIGVDSWNYEDFLEFVKKD